MAAQQNVFVRQNPPPPQEICEIAQLIKKLVATIMSIAFKSFQISSKQGEQCYST